MTALGADAQSVGFDSYFCELRQERIELVDE